MSYKLSSWNNYQVNYSSCVVVIAEVTATFLVKLLLQVVSPL